MTKKAEPQTTDVLRAAIYSRMSLDRNGEGLGVERQIEKGRSKVKGNEWKLTVDPAVTSDNSLSAAGSVTRPGFERLLGLIESGQIDAVYAYSFDRLARNQTDGVRFLKAAREHNIQVAFTSGGELDLTNALGRFVAEMMLAIAALEINIKSERQKIANDQRATNGDLWKSTPRPFGWLRDLVTPHPVEGPALAEAYNLMLNGGTLRSVATRWNAGGLLGTFKGKPWTSAGVRRVLLNPRNAGRHVQAGEDYGTFGDGIVSGDTFDAVTRLLSDKARTTKRGPRRLLSGLASCPCGKPVQGAKTARGKLSYRCAPTPGQSTAGCVHRVAEPVDLFVERLAVERLSRDDAVDLLEPAGESPDVNGLYERRSVLLAKAEELMREYVDPDTKLTRRQLDAGTDKIKRDVSEIDAVLDGLKTTSVLAPLVYAEDVGAVWEDYDLDRKRAVIAELFQEIVLESPGRGRTGRPVEDTVHRVWRLS